MAEITYTELTPSSELWFGPTNVARKDYSHRYSDSNQHVFYFGGEGSPLTPESMVRVDYSIVGQPEQPSLFYGPGTKLGPFISQAGNNRTMSLNPNGEVVWYYVFIAQATP